MVDGVYVFRAVDPKEEHLLEGETCPKTIVPRRPKHGEAVSNRKEI